MPAAAFHQSDPHQRRVTGLFADQAGTQNNYDQAADKALSAQDVPQSFVLADSYGLPFGSGKRFLNHSRAANAIVGGWSVGAVQTYASGTPISIRCSNSYISGLLVPSLGGNPPSCRPNVVPGVPLYLSNQGPFVFGKTQDLNPAAFAEPANFTLGNASRVSNIRLPASLDEDLSIEKRFTFTEKFNAMLRLEMFNAFNRHTFGGLDNIVTDPSFGRFTNAGGNRTMQMRLRISF